MLDVVGEMKLEDPSLIGERSADHIGVLQPNSSRSVLPRLGDHKRAFTLVGEHFERIPGLRMIRNAHHICLECKHNPQVQKSYGWNS